MLSSASRLFFHLGLIVSLLSAVCLTYTIPGVATVPNIGDKPPDALRTTIISPQCTNINNGTYLCCAGTVDGGNPLVAALANAAQYQLPANTVNGLACTKSFTTCDDTTVCCQTITLLPAAGLWCHSA